MLSMGVNRDRTESTSLQQGVAAAAMALLMLGALLTAGSAAFGELSSTPREETWVTNGAVRAIATTPTTTYIGGDFTYVGPNTGSFAVLDAGTGAVALPYAKVDGNVLACVPDGTGGWYIGGDFTRVGAMVRNRIAHILPGGTLDPAWNPNANSDVYALAVSGTTVYAGGSFTGIGGQTRNRIAALDAVTGAASTWNPNANNSVGELAVSGTTVYAGGYFTSIGGQTRNYIGALDATTGLATAWNPNANGAVTSLAVSGTTVYSGGTFTTIGGQTRNYIAALDATTGLASAWNPNASGYVYAFAVSGTTVYVGGNFTGIGGQTRNRIAALNAATGLATAWNPNASSTVTSLAVSGTTVHVGGGFTTVGGQTRNYIAALDATTGLATAWNPNAGSTIQALAVSGMTVCAGGTFTSIGGQTRNYIAALDATTGTATAWDPNAGLQVYALAVSGTTVYAGGAFNSIGGLARNNIAALDAATGVATAWNPNANSWVFALVVSGTTVYAGGGFTTIGGQTRNRIAALNATVNTNNATAWNPNANNVVRSLAMSGTTVYAGGGFTTIGGQTRNYLAALDTTTGLATAWNPNASGTVVRVLEVSGTTVYAGGQFTSIGGQTRSNIAALGTSTGLATAWSPNADNIVYALAVSGTTVYAGGAFTTIGGQTRNRIAALDATTGLAAAWNPNADATVYRLAVSGTRVYAGGDFTTIGGQTQPYFAQFDTPLPAAPSNPGATAIGADTITWTWQDNSVDETGFKVYDDPGAGPPATLRTTRAANVQSWQHNGLTPNTQYAFQVAATNAIGDSVKTANYAKYTLCGPPSLGNNIACDKSLSTLYGGGTTFTFSNPAGFGAGSHGGSVYRVSKFKYAWDTSATHTFTGTETDWTTGTLPQTPVASGSYYLHLQAFNGEDVANATTLDLGPFLVDADAPIAAAGDTPNVDQTSNATQYNFTILYIDETAMQVSTLNNADIRVTGPNGFNVLATLVSSDPGTNADLETATYRITPPGGSWNLADEGVYTVSLEASQVTDTAGNFAGAGELGGFQVDFAPTATLASAAPATVNGAIPITVVLSEPSTNFAAGDIQCTSASVANFAGTGTAYSFNLVPSGTGVFTFSCSVPAGRFTDTDGMGKQNLASNTISRVCDLTPPTAAITLDGTTPTGRNVVAFSVDFGEGVGVTFDGSDVSVTGTLAGTAVVSGTDPSYTVTVTLINPAADGTVDISIGTGVTDLAGNPYAGGASPAYTIANWRGILTQPLSVRGYTGGAATLSVTPDCAGGAAISYQWKYDDGLDKAIENGPAAPQWALVLTQSVVGQYWCTMSYDGEAYESNHVGVDVADPLVITEDPQGGEKNVGESHTFSVMTTGGFLPLSYLWKMNGEVVTDAMGASYTIASLTELDAGTYTVEVSDNYADVEASAEAELTVNADTLPASGPIGLGLLAACLAVAGMFSARAIRNQRKAISAFSEESARR